MMTTNNESVEYVLLHNVREMISHEWTGFLTEKGTDRLSRIRAGAPSTGQLTKLIHQIQEKMCGDQYFGIQNFIKDYQDFPGVLSMEGSLLKLSVHLETVPPETNEARYYLHRVLWLEKFCHITGVLVGQIDVILSFLKGRQPGILLRKTKAMLDNCLHENEQQTYINKLINSVSQYCTIL